MSDKLKPGISDQKLKQLFNRPEVPEGLASSLRRNLSEQIEHEHGRFAAWWRTGFSLSLVANLVLAGIIFMAKSDNQATQFMDMAYAHVLHETELHGDFVGDMHSAHPRDEIRPPVSPYQVNLTKNCLIGLEQARHIRVSDPGGGNINLLIFDSGNEKFLPTDRSGTRGSQYWERLQPRDDVNVLVFYENQGQKQRAHELVGQIFQAAGEAAAVPQRGWI